MFRLFTFLDLLESILYEERMRENRNTFTDNELHLLAKTMWGEARGEGKQGMKHVGSVVLNRTNNRRYPSTIEAVVRQPNQFYVWQGTLARRTSSVTESDPLYRVALEAARELLTHGPINQFLSFDAHTHRGGGTIIGGHRFR